MEGATTEPLIQKQLHVKVSEAGGGVLVASLIDHWSAVVAVVNLSNDYVFILSKILSKTDWKEGKKNKKQPRRRRFWPEKSFIVLQRPPSIEPSPNPRAAFALRYRGAGSRWIQVDPGGSRWIQVCEVPPCRRLLPVKFELLSLFGCRFSLAVSELVHRDIWFLFFSFLSFF